MKRVELIFNLLAIPLDAAMVLTSAVLAYFLRIKFANIWPILFEIAPGDYLRTILFILPFLVVLFALYGLYNLRSTDKLGSELARIVAAVTTALMVVVLIFFFDRDVFPSRLIVLMSWGITIALVGAGRIVLRFIRDGQLRKGRGVHKLVVIAGQKTDKKLVDNIKTSPELGYNIVSILQSDQTNLLGRLEEIKKQDGLDEVLQADPELPSPLSSEIVTFCHDRGIKFNLVPDVFGVSTTRIDIEILDGSPIIKLKGTPLDGWGRIAKRVLDIIIAGLALILLSPVILAIVILIKIDSRGPVIYKAPRYGLASDFLFYKFRSMHTHLSVGEGYGGEEAQKIREELVKQSTREGPLKKIKNDPRVTKVGRFLRRYKLDEIPQLWNVLKGDMSMVGPRAHVLDEVAEYRDHYKRLFIIKPGITGLTQITQMKRPDLPFADEIRIDSYYIENWSLWLDIKILWRTFWLLITRQFSREDY